jgi:hypothetical protein
LPKPVTKFGDQHALPASLAQGQAVSEGRSLKDFPVCPVAVRNITDTLRHGRTGQDRTGQDRTGSRFDEERTGGVGIHLGQKSGDHPLPADGAA